ncbi:MAG: hypothetical protein QOJ99_2698 [Bryobacterales bacterium]|nr:hypothetical protein [Bryobacterales bacterium]
MRIVFLLVLASSAATAQSSDVATLERKGDFATLSVNSLRPLDAIATTLESQFGIAVGAEDPVSQSSSVRPVIPAPARWGFEVQFPLTPDGKPRDVGRLLESIVTAAKAHSEFAYRLDEDNGIFSFVPTRTRDAEGRSVALTPLLDQPITILPGIRKIHETAALMAKDLSKQTGLHVSCCQSSVAGVLWGMAEMPFSAGGEPARVVLRRLGLNHWHMRCDATFCFIEKR